MNGTTGTADLLWGTSRSVHEELTLLELTELHRVSNNLGVYFLFCLFGLAILALFLCHCMQVLQTSLFFSVLCRQVWQVFIYQYINKFLQAGYSGFQVTGMIEWGQKSKIPKIPGPKFSPPKIPAKFPSQFPLTILIRVESCYYLLILLPTKGL